MKRKERNPLELAMCAWCAKLDRLYETGVATGAEPISETLIADAIELFLHMPRDAGSAGADIIDLLQNLDVTNREDAITIAATAVMSFRKHVCIYGGFLAAD